MNNNHDHKVRHVEEKIENILVPNGYAKTTLDRKGLFRRSITVTPETIEAIAGLLYAHTDKAIEEVLNELERQGTAGVGLMGDTYIPLSAIYAERRKIIQKDEA